MFTMMDTGATLVGCVYKYVLRGIVRDVRKRARFSADRRKIEGDRGVQRTVSVSYLLISYFRGTHVITYFRFWRKCCGLGHGGLARKKAYWNRLAEVGMRGRLFLLNAVSRGFFLFFISLFPWHAFETNVF